jgi:hypothetical protein
VKIQNIKELIAALVMSVTAMPVTVLAVQVNFEPASLSLPQVKPYSVTLLIDTEGESVNAIEGTVTADDALGNITSVSDSGSFITYWVNRPELANGGKSATFSGAIPGGFSGKGILFTLVMPNYEGGGIAMPFKISGIKAFRNDGLGTQAQVSVKEFAFGQNSLPIADVADQLYLDDSKTDNIPPEVFSPQLSQDDRVFDGKWFINFAAQDKQSGIDHYEIQETRSGAINAGKWKVVESPYMLEDQELHSYIYVIAIDRQGNERMIKVFPRNPLAWYRNYKPALFFAGAVGIIGLFGYIIRKRKAATRNKYR